MNHRVSTIWLSFAFSEHMGRDQLGVERRLHPWEHETIDRLAASALKCVKINVPKVDNKKRRRREVIFMHFKKIK